MKLKIGICKGCDLEKLIILSGKKLCYTCNNIRLLKIKFEKLKPKLEHNNKLKQFYQDFYNAHPTKTCFETGVVITHFKPWNCHHLLEKAIYPQHTFNTQICVLLTQQMHAQWHSIGNIDREIKMPKTYAKYLQLKQKYNL